MGFSIKGATALVTGANRGIGEAWWTTVHRRAAKIYAGSQPLLDLVR